jgi:hypothetical protein
VPPGLYRVWARAPGYEDHISPNIRVIREIVRYHVPGRVYLPLVVRNYKQVVGEENDSCS